MKLNKNLLRENIIDFLIAENKSKLSYERKRLTSLIESKEDYYFSKHVLNEGFMDSMTNMLGAGADSVKSYFISGLLESLGIQNEKAKGIIGNIIEQLDMSDLMGFMTGSYGCESLTEDVVKGLVEFALEDGIESIAGYIDDLDIPMIDGLVQQFKGGEGMLDNAEEEQLVNTITDKLYPIIGEKIEGFICDLGIVGRGESADSGEEENEEDLVSEILDFNIYDATQKIKLYSSRNKKLMLKQNE